MSDEFARYNEVHIHQGRRLVNPAVVRWKRLDLPREQSRVSGWQKSAEGLVATPVMKARTVIGAVGLQPHEWSCTGQSTSVELARFG